MLCNVVVLDLDNFLSLHIAQMIIILPFFFTLTSSLGQVQRNHKEFDCNYNFLFNLSNILHLTPKLQKTCHDGNFLSVHRLQPSRQYISYSHHPPLKTFFCFSFRCVVVFAMLVLSSAFYSVSLWLLNFFKWAEYAVLKIFTPLVEKVVKTTFRKAGVEIDGNNPWDLQVHKKQYFPRIASYATLGAGEAYMEGWADCEDFPGMFQRVFRSDVYKELLHPVNKLLAYFNLQTKIRAFQVGQEHYDTGNDLFEAMLDSSMNYSCGYWKNATNLEEAQMDKMDLIARKLMLKPGMRVLDIGCGWGGLARYLAENYDVQVVGITISEEQAKLCRERCQNLPVEIRLVDYRDIHEKFDRVVSVGMFEHVGHNNYRTYFKVVNRCLVDDGIFLLHTIGTNHKDVPVCDPWFHKYIFPNGILPYQKHILDCTEGLFVMEDWHNFGHDYSRTLEAWLANFKKAWPQLEPFYGKTFYRMWIYYLSLSIGAFRSRRFNLWQIVLSKEGLEGGYYAPR